MYEEVAYTSHPISDRFTARCGVRWTPSTATRAPAAWAAEVMDRTSGMVPMTLDEPVTATHRVAGPTRLVTASAASRPPAGSNSAMRTTAPESRAASSHGATLASWSRVVHTISSPGPNPWATALVRAIMLAVVLGP